jgi:small subunit ribosomal protein S8e
MGISRDSEHKRRKTGGKPKAWRKKRKYELGRVPGNTKLVTSSTSVAVRRIRVRGGHFKFRALRLDAGNFAWPSEAVTKKVRVLDVTYNASNNELVRTQTLVKGAVVQIDAAPFRQWYQQHYGVEVGLKKGVPVAKKEGEAPVSQSSHVKRKLETRVKEGKPLDAVLDEQFSTGRLYAVITSRPGQCGRCDGYVLEGKELAFYAKKMQKKKGGASAA